MFDFFCVLINEIRSYFVPEKVSYEITGECKKCGKCCNYMYSYDTYTEKEFRNILEAIVEDANGDKFKIVPYDELYFDNMRLAYFPNLQWNRDDNSKLTYFIYYEIENIRLKNTGKSKNYDEIMNNLPNNAILLTGNDKLKVYRYIEN